MVKFDLIRWKVYVDTFDDDELPEHCAESAGNNLEKAAKLLESIPTSNPVRLAFYFYWAKLQCEVEDDKTEALKTLNSAIEAAEGHEITRESYRSTQPSKVKKNPRVKNNLRMKKNPRPLGVLEGWSAAEMANLREFRDRLHK